MSRYLLTGTAGFIASRVAALLLEQGHEVLGVDNINDAYDQRLKQWRLEQLRTQPGFTFHKGDISDRRCMDELAAQGCFNAVINLAARAGVRQSTEDPWVYLETNVAGTLNLLELCRRKQIGKFVLASTSSLYGANNPLPYKEDADTNQPLSPYAASKKGAEALCYSYHHLYGIDTTVFRYFTVYGPAGRPDMSVFRFVQWIAEGKPVMIYGDGDQSRDFTYVDDIALGTIAGLCPLGYRIVNLGSDRPFKVSDLVRAVEEHVGAAARLEYREAHRADVPATWADISCAREVLGWSPQTGFEDGVKKSAEWYLANREWAREIRTA